MGWWSTSPTSSDPPAASRDGATASPLLPSTSTSSSEPPSKPMTREQQADAELEAFLASLEAPSKPRRSASSTPAPAAEQPSSPPLRSWSSLWRSTPTISSPPTEAEPPEPTLDISPRALRPRTMSCRAAFDSAFYCASLGGKFNDIYRFGSLQPCSEHWEAFWFCMRNRSLGGDEEDKGGRVADHYEQREEREKQRRALGRSSEDVWEMRTVPVEKAFWKVP